MQGRIPVVVTTEHRGVFFGFTDPNEIKNKSHIVLKDCRNCLSWHSSIGGFLGLSSVGPNQHCRIGAKANEVVLHDITSVSICTEEAASKWISA